jgi:BirA family biotin operon repressor/biotin-[acetyl-CoA-carboxylase] ligase
VTKYIENLDADRILAAIDNYLTPEVIVLDAIDSLMDKAKELAARGIKDWTVVVAEEQTKGRGRRGRTWYSLRSLGLYFTVLLSEIFLGKAWRNLPIITALAVIETLQITGCANVKAKWPNDIIIGGKKIAGILIEKPAKLNAYIIGVGINVHHRAKDLRPELQDAATSIFLETERDLSRNIITGYLIKNINRKIVELDTVGENAVVNAYIGFCETLGKTVEVVCGNEVVSGIAETVAPDGSLVIKTVNGQKNIYAGDIETII